MKKIFIFLIFFLFSTNILNANAITESSFNNFTNSLNIGNYIQTTYYRWKCNSNNKCEKTQTKTDGDFDSESKCLDNCPSKAMTYTASGITNNFNFNFTTTTKTSFNSYSPSNLNISDFKATTNSITTLPTTSTDSLSGFNFSAPSLQTLTSKTTIPAVSKNSTFIQPTIKSDSVEGLEPVTIGKNIFSSLLQGLGIMQPSSILNNSNILTIPKTGSDDATIQSRDIIPTTKCIIDSIKVTNSDKPFTHNGRDISFLTRPKCGQGEYPLLYAEVSYKNTKNEIQHTYPWSYIAIEEDFNFYLQIPQDILAKDNTIAVDVTMYQCKMIKSAWGNATADPFCLEHIQEGNADFIKKQSFVLDFDNTKKDTLDKCQFSIFAPEENEIFQDILPVKTNNMTIGLRVDCPEFKTEPIPQKKTISVYYNLYCRDNETKFFESRWSIWEKRYKEPLVNSVTYSTLGKTDFIIDKMDLYETWFRSGNYRDCEVRMTINQPSEEEINIIRNFKIDKCQIELKNTNDIVYYSSKTTHIPLEMVFYCDRNSQSLTPTALWLTVLGPQNKMYDYIYGSYEINGVSSGIVRQNYKWYKFDWYVDLGDIAKRIFKLTPNMAQTESRMNVGLHAIFDKYHYPQYPDGDYPWFFNNSIKDSKEAIVRFYYDGESPEINPPKDGTGFIPSEPEPTTSTTKGDDNQPQPGSKSGILKRILNFFGINLK